MAWMHRFPAGLTEAQIDALADHLGRNVPRTFGDLLKQCNGMSLFGGLLSISGYVTLVRRDPNDIIGQPISLRYGNLIRVEKINPDWFIIGGATGEMLHVRYALRPDGRIEAGVWDGHLGSCCQWGSIRDFFDSEIDRLSPLHDENGELTVPRSFALPGDGPRWDMTAAGSLH